MTTSAGVSGGAAGLYGGGGGGGGGGSTGGSSGAGAQGVLILTYSVIGPDYDPDALAYFAAMTVQPDTARKILINDLIVGLKADGLWGKIDWLLLLASHDAQAARINVRVPTKIATAINAPTFTTDRGYQGNGVNAYLDAGEALNAPGNVYAQNSAHLLTYINAGPGGTPYDIGAIGNTNIRMQAEVSGSTENARINTGNSDSYTSTGPIGMRILSRTGAAAGDLYRDGVAKFGNTIGPSSATMTGNLNLLRGQAGAIQYSSSRLAVAGSGGGLTSIQAANFRSRLMTYLTAIGAN
ncbi:hypothetical protein [Sphingomonas sp. Root710]|uniref:hypothetical protein n=1 Tax=Sphingomonas sp. Root710 TaxID=1736594 RepID=UPI000AB21D50|nr:hypothetical protein [Sphingomonas sp. Root710]